MKDTLQKIKDIVQKIWSFIRTNIRTKWGIATVAVGIILIGYFILHSKNPAYAFITVTRGPISETVSVTGSTVPMQSVSLGFQNGGTISFVSVSVGDSVTTGQVLARLNTGDLSAQLKQAQANVDAQNAKLQGLKEGARPEDIVASQAAAAKAGQDLANMYGSIVNLVNDAYSKTNDAVRTQIGTLFSNAENNSIQLNFNTSNSQAAIDAKSQRLDMATRLNDWQAQISMLNVVPGVPELDNLVQKSFEHLHAARTLLNSVSVTLNGAVNLDATTLATDKSEVATGLTEVNTATTNLTTLSQNIASQKLTVAQANAALSLKQAGSSNSDILAQQAMVAQAEANVESIQAKLYNSIIVAPISGMITQNDAKVGQNASPSVTLISIISNNTFQIESLIPETDIGKIHVGDLVDVTFDAFPGEKFTGKLFYIDPAQTITSGVVDYKIKVSFDTVDPRVKSGLTANLDIKTKTDENALILPQYALLQNDNGTFIQTLQNGVATQTPVTIGIQDQNGNVEILSGVTEGEQVVNVGLKQ